MRRAAVLAVVALAGCGKKSAPVLDAAWFGTAPVPPGKLAALKPQSTLAEARSVVGPEAKLDEHGEGSQRVPTGRDEVTAAVSFMGGRAWSVFVWVRTKGCEPLLIKAWGAGTVADFRGIGPERRWTNPAGEWQATLTAESAGTCQVLFELYRPATGAFFGAIPAPPPALAQIKLGMTVDEAHAIAPELIGDAGDAATRLMYTTGWIGPSNVKGRFATDDATQRIKALVLQCEPEVMPVIEAAWGKGTPAPDDELEWKDPTGAFHIHAAYEAGKAFFLLFEAPPPTPPPGGPP